MIYDIVLRIGYEYQSPAAGSRHVLYLAPADGGLQRVIASLLDITPQPDERVARTDFFGNTTVEVAFQAPHGSIEFKLRARVEKTCPVAGKDSSTPLERLSVEIAGNRLLDGDSPHHFLADSPRVRVRPEFEAYARTQIAPGMQSTWEIVDAIGKALDRDIKFDPGSTNVDTPPEEAFARRHGVCQDFSHIMIACLRAIGVPAAYASGFLRTLPPEGEAHLEGADAMHAWVRAWCGEEAGWREYDPTNGIAVKDQHIVVAYGRDYGDVAPVRGVVRTSGGQSSTQAVDVIPVPGQAKVDATGS
jgi:transglutaminase-like putative cysteine protease